MEAVLDWGIRVILWLQGGSPLLDLPFIAITSLGSEEFLLVAMAFVLWCIDRRAGARLAALVLLSAWLNAVAKEIGMQPRPFEWDHQVRMIFPATGFGLPSGHTQGTVVLWGYLALTYRRRWLWALAAVLMVLVPLSRLYLGAHFPTDLLGGYVLGALILWAYWRLEPAVEGWLSRRTLAVQVLLAAAVPLVLWAGFASPDESLVTALGTTLGAGIGFTLERGLIAREAGGPWKRRLLGLALGVAVVLALRFGLKAVFEGLQPEAAWRFARYAAMGLWGGLGAPWAMGLIGAAGGGRGAADKMPQGQAHPAKG